MISSEASVPVGVVLGNNVYIVLDDVLEASPRVSDVGSVNESNDVCYADRHKEGHGLLRLDRFKRAVLPTQFVDELALYRVDVVHWPIME